MDPSASKSSTTFSKVGNESDHETRASSEAPGFFDPVFPHDGQSEDSNVTGQDQPMAERQGMAVEGRQGQRRRGGSSA